ncbi:hypothetical protein PUN28_004089 [Cardiocondyla obscurior]|uniref:Uncharacterized protein n=1 Tax=Cardiocondyla obscurior TaxID=286306 RepID=A0AAW2GPJ1_9HYME
MHANIARRAASRSAVTSLCEVHVYHEIDLYYVTHSLVLSALSLLPRREGIEMHRYFSATISMESLPVTSLT